MIKWLNDTYTFQGRKFLQEIELNAECLGHTLTLYFVTLGFGCLLGHSSVAVVFETRNIMTALAFTMVSYSIIKVKCGKYINYMMLYKCHVYT